MTLTTTINPWEKTNSKIHNYFNNLNKNLLSLVEKGKFKLNQFKASDKKNEESGRIILEALSFIYAGYFCSEKNQD